ncbi:cyclin-dependent kinase inhibitor 7-like [Arachis stenosperma]|uniref:cyclin-dependent kinase inhibitor 7-like n=1 Tax=Arachis stenosperma TaxID=217475 RepID=UPI0025AD6E3C|nr:cyclin-dependent kinase inhibitor 7-like [Arachis stenosperma]
MSDCKRCVPLASAMEASSSSEDNVSNKRKTTTSYEFLLTSTSDAPHRQRLPSFGYSLAAARFNDVTVSPEGSLNSSGTVVSFEFCSDRSPRSFCSSAFEVAMELDTTPLDLEVQTKGFVTVDSTFHNFKSSSLLSEQCGDSEESAAVVRQHEQKSTAAKKEKVPEVEIEEFFAMAEKYEQKRFAEKYNFDIVADMPLEGRYQWVRLQ